MEIIIGALIFLAGYMTCFFTVKKSLSKQDVVSTVKRVKPSLRNPMKTYNVEYEKYKHNGLYQPTKAKSGDK